MSLSFKHFLDLTHLQPLAAILIQMLKGFLNESLPVVGEWANDTIDELIDGDGTTVIIIEAVENVNGFFIAKVKVEVIYCVKKLLLVNEVRAIKVHQLELLLQTDNSLCSSGVHLLLEKFHVYLLLSQEGFLTKRNWGT